MCDVLMLSKKLPLLELILPYKIAFLYFYHVAWSELDAKIWNLFFMKILYVWLYGMGSTYVPFVYRFFILFFFLFFLTIFRALTVPDWEIMEFEYFQWETGDIYVSVVLDRMMSMLSQKSHVVQFLNKKAKKTNELQKRERERERDN